jgi:AcrR family transcriptional regulator
MYTDSPLRPRAELAELTREHILRGMGRMITAGSESFTFKALAQISGVPERTIYRHFGDKDALYQTFYSWLNDQIIAPDPPLDPADLARYTRDLYASFDRQPELVRAMLNNPIGRELRDAQAALRTAKFVGALSGIANRLAEPEATALLASVEVLCSATGWDRLTRMTGPDKAADAAAWAIAALIEKAENT